MNLPWLVGGDFNVIVDEEEKYGSLPVTLNEVEDFRHYIQTCNLSDLGYKGSTFTWWNGRAVDECVFKRLDKCLGNFELQQQFPGSEVSHLIKLGFDHFPLLVVKDNWKTDVVANSFMTFNVKLKNLKKTITTLEEVIKTHEALFEEDPSHANKEKLQKVQAEMTRSLHIEEEYWKKKYGMTWFQERDKNYKFFHAHVKGRRKRLQLKRIQNSQGQWLETEHEIAEEAVRFYQAQFHETVVPTQFDILKHVPSMVTDEQNEELTADPTMEEVKHAVFGLNNASAGGPDGFTSIFFQACWDIIGGDIFNMVWDFFRGHELPRMVHLLPDLISQNQAGFVRGRSIVENILLTQEIITDIRLRTRKRNQVVPNVVMKLDMTKAYDRLS
ncbi:uncharacterized protein LOC132628671 [Lycium barbarum]|uniref:uncharacterized protein LOC132628671 n=1 Tax=Lycium barbarum TaxID=112863 RepID=UPI00293E926A|nr:uncharacterized protein LOC132628671 [Lycium barbarum]